MKKIVIVAGDKSGDLYGGLLSKRLTEKFSSCKIYSFGGESLALHSHQVINLLSHSVCGLAEVLSSLKNLINIFKETLSNIRKINPDLVILIDFPDFNLRLAKKLNKEYPLFYYVSPQIWAWRKGRIKQIKKYVDKMIVIFNFEKEFYRKHGIEALYFGHPLLEIIPTESIDQKKIISFLPGSRINEVKRHLPVMAMTKKILEKSLNGYVFRIIKPQNLDNSIYKPFSEDIDIVDHSYRSIAESKFIIASSGTATVEIAILEVPYVIIYKVNPVSWHLLKRMVKTEFIGMINLLSSKSIIKELLQKEANPEKIAAVTSAYLENKDEYFRLKEELKKTKDILSPYGATENLSEFIGRHLSLSPRIE